jgi:hypothetical protein
MKASGKLRSLVAVLVLGTVLLFMAISVLDAVSALRTEWRRRASGDDVVPATAPDPPPVMLHPNPPRPAAPARGGWDAGPPASEPESRWAIKAKR